MTFPAVWYYSCPQTRFPTRLYHISLPTMVVSLSWSIGHDDLHAAVRSVVGSLSLFTIVVTHIVGIGLLKLSRNGRWKGMKSELILSTCTYSETLL